MNPNDCNDPLTFHPAPQAGQKLNLSMCSARIIWLQAVICLSVVCLCVLSVNAGSTALQPRPSIRSAMCTSHRQTQVILCANITQRLCHCITLHTAHKTMITHSALSGLYRGDVIWSRNWNANIPREIRKVCLRQAVVLWWSNFSRFHTWSSECSLLSCQLCCWSSGWAE